MPLPSHRALLGTQSRDYKLDACIDFAHANWKTATPKIIALQRVLKLYRYNVSRVRLLMLAPANIATLSMQVQRWKDIAEVETTRSIDKPIISDVERSKINNRSIEISIERTIEDAKLLGTPAWDAHVLDHLKIGAEPFKLYASAHAVTGAIDAMLSSYITGAWTAFEALSADLWETALNEHPIGLANLDGKLSRLTKTKQSNDNPRGSDREFKNIRLDFAHRFGFDLKDKMGTIFLLQRRYEFTRLSGIRSAYIEAFSTDYSQIDSVIADDGLDALSIVRNLLVHKAGIADSEYAKRAKNLKVPKLAIGELIKLDGEIAVGLIKTVFDRGAKLIAAVDAWIANHQ